MRIKYFTSLLVVLTFLSFNFAYGQKTEETSISVTEEEACGLVFAPLLSFEVSVGSLEKGFLKDLTVQDFEIFVDGEKMEVIFFLPPGSKSGADDSKHFIFGLLPPLEKAEYAADDFEVEIKLSEEKIAEFGAVFIRIHKQEFGMK